MEKYRCAFATGRTSKCQRCGAGTAEEVNGKITGVTNAMEYTADAGQSWILVPEGASEIDVAPGNYGVRFKATATSFSSETTGIKVNTYKEEHPDTDDETDKGNSDEASGDPGKNTESDKSETKKEPEKEKSDTALENSSGNKQSNSNKAKVTKAQKLKNSCTLSSKFKVYIKDQKINVRWGTVKGATGYNVYVAYSHKRFSKKPAKSVVTDAKKLSVKKTSYSLKAGKSATIKAKTVKRDKKKKLLKQISQFRYTSSNTSTAAVSKKGTIKAKKKGVCYIYVYAVNGYTRKIKVRVK